jgi:hypothetical protein
MSAAWLEVEGPGGPRRVPLQAGRTRVGGRGAEVELAGIGAGELHVWSDPPRALYLAGPPDAVRPVSDGAPFEELALRPGTRIEWGPHRLVYGGRAAPRDQAELEELPAAPGHEEPEALLARLGRRVAAGALCEAGMIERQAQKRWQDAVLGGTFDPEACVRELLPEPLPPALAGRALDRSGTLLRDFLMAARTSGMRGAARRARERARSALAFVVVQAGVLVLFALILLAIMLVLRLHHGVSFDALLDRLVP